MYLPRCEGGWAVGQDMMGGGEIVVTERAFWIASHPPSSQIEWGCKGVWVSMNTSCSWPAGRPAWIRFHTLWACLVSYSRCLISSPDMPSCTDSSYVAGPRAENWLCYIHGKSSSCYINIVAYVHSCSLVLVHSSKFSGWLTCTLDAD